MENKRIEFIDIAKGIAICCMVFGHTCSEGNGGAFLKLIYSFHMPLFFISSGVLYRKKTQSKLNFDIRKKVHDIMIPYFLWSILYRLFISVLQIAGGLPIKKTLYSNIKNIVLFGGSSMWFLPAMFYSYIMFFFLYSMFQHKIISELIGIIIMFIVLFSVDYYDNYFFAFFAKSIIGVGFMFIGYLSERLSEIRISKFTLTFLTLCHIYIVLSNEIVSIAAMSFGNPLIYVLMSSAGTFVIYMWSKLIFKNNKISHILMLWGRHSIKVLYLHVFVIQVIRFIDYKLFNDILPKCGYFEPFIFTAIIMAILTVVLKKNTNLLN